jgi:hypothetical protein
VVQVNPLKAQDEMLIVMKASDKIDKYSLDNWFVPDENKLAKLF